MGFEFNAFGKAIGVFFFSGETECLVVSFYYDIISY